MSGHSKWASIKHKKAAMDAKKGKIFTKLIKEITAAARIGGGHPDGNPRLRTAIQAAKDANMPNDNIKKAIQKGTGELPGTYYEEVSYEGYGIGGVAVLVNVLTDNKNRTVSEIRYIFSKNGGSLGETGCVSWMFSKKGLIMIEEDKVNEDELIDIVLNEGAEDVKRSEGQYEITMTPESFENIENCLKQNNIEISFAEITMVPQSTVRLERKEAQQMLKLMEGLEDHDDVQQVYANFDIPKEVMETIEV
ncbi:MAG TPA: YebC/PmpR family DNA-binding transcriptional regulator [Nitrospinota bacterium]|nr:YebC/PmpR family DNA-binding transcriptional regulator [Nitrospinota bacterium]